MNRTPRSSRHCSLLPAAGGAVHAAGIARMQQPSMHPDP